MKKTDFLPALINEYFLFIRGANISITIDNNNLLKKSIQSQSDFSLCKLFIHNEKITNKKEKRL